MTNFVLEGLNELDKILDDLASNDLDDLQASISNNQAHALVAEYGSIPGSPPWPSPAEKTEMATDKESGEPKVVSTQGFGALRNNLDDAEKVMNLEWQKVDLTKNIRTQAKKVLNKACAKWFQLYVHDLPQDEGDLVQAAKMEKA